MKYYAERELNHSKSHIKDMEELMKKVITIMPIIIIAALLIRPTVAKSTDRQEKTHEIV